MILIDSSVWIDYFNGNKTAQTDWLDSSLGNTPIIIGDLILTEVLQGFQSDKDFKIARSSLRHPIYANGRKGIGVRECYEL